MSNVYNFMGLGRIDSRIMSNFFCLPGSLNPSI